MLRQSLALTAGCLLAIPAAAQSPKPAFEFDHVWFAVLPGAPERAALERAGLLFASEINRHDGQGTASITVEFANVFFELIYPDSTVPVAPGRDAFARRLSQRVRWRTTGVAPFGFHVRRAAETPDSLPFPTWSVRAEWMPPGAEFANITPRTDTITPSFTVLPRSMGTVEVTAANVATVEPARRTALSQPLGLRRLTGVGLVVPRTYQMTDAMQIFQSLGAVTVTRGEAWCVELTFDNGARNKTLDLRSTIPLVVRY